MTDYPFYREFRDGLADVAFLKKSGEALDILTDRFGEVHLTLANDVVSLAQSLGWNCQDVFLQYIFDYLKEQMAFEQTGEYGHTDFEQIREEILDDPEIMQKLYLPGLFLAYPLTAILFHKYVFFRNSFLPRLSADSFGAEIGYGDGFYLWVMLRNVPGMRLTGFDISRPAQKFAVHLLTHAGIEPERFDLQVANVIDGTPTENHSLDWVLLPEIIEHLPDPSVAIAEAARILKPGGSLYVATMIDSNHMDHISNFDSPLVVEQMITDQNFSIQDQMTYRVTDDLPDSSDRAVSIAFIAQKN